MSLIETVVTNIDLEELRNRAANAQPGPSRLLATLLPEINSASREPELNAEQVLLPKVATMWQPPSDMLTVTEDEASCRSVLLSVVDTVIETHLDTMEWMRGQAIATGRLDWSFASTSLRVDYGLTPERFFPLRTGAKAYSVSDETFVADVSSAHALLDGLTMIMVCKDSQAISSEALSRVSQEFNCEVVLYDHECETALGEKIQCWPLEKILCLGKPQIQKYGPLGYTHIGPTVEGNNAPGRWAQVVLVPKSITGSSSRTPITGLAELIPASINAQHSILEVRAVTNGMPIIENTARYVVLSSSHN